MGFKYFDAEFNRREVIKKFKNNKIIIFPSTIDYGESFREKFELKKSIELYNKHDHLYLIAREEKTFNKFKEIYPKCKIMLQPDIVLYMKSRKYDIDRKNVGIYLRNDIESAQNSLNFKELKSLYRLEYLDNIADKNLITLDERKKIVEDKLKEIASFKMVITDRLHVTIFCAITNTPCLFLNNTNKKIEGVYKMWLYNLNYIKQINKNEKLLEQVKNLMKHKNNEYKNYSFEEIKNNIK